MSVELTAALIIGSLMVALAIGIPVAFALMGVGLVFALVVLGPPGLYMVITATWQQISSSVMLAIPLFVFMAMVLEFSGIGESLFEATYKWFGSLGGGLAIGVIVASTLLAAITGLSATAVVVMGVLAIPEMRKRGYNNGLILGCIPAGGVLGPIIPPSIYLIVFAMMAEESVGRLFIGTVTPGLIISFLFCAYIIVRSISQPKWAPGVPPAERASWKEKFLLLKGIIAPVALILVVLGSIYGGITTVTEAAAVGAFGALVVSIIYRKLTWAKLRQGLSSSLLLTGMIMWIATAGTLYAGVLRASGAANVIQELIMGLPLSATGLLIFMLVIALILGMLMDPVSITLITIPLFVPIVVGMGINLVFFGVVYSLALVIGQLTPPFAMTLFYFKAIVPNEKVGDIYRASIPWIAIMTAVLFLCVAFPDIVLWLPSQMS